MMFRNFTLGKRSSDGGCSGMEHHVYFWLKPERDNAADRSVFEKGLADLFEIDEVAGGMWGGSAPTAERPVTDKSFDYALSMQFVSLVTHDRYQEHPEHDVFVDQFKDWWQKVLVMDVG